jgi:hypothetical protein
MNTQTQLVIAERSRRAQIVAALGLWVAGAALGATVAWRMAHPPRHHAADGMTQTSEQTEPVSTMDWSIDGTGDAVEIDGALVMPEDVIVSHRPVRAGVAVMQKP